MTPFWAEFCLRYITIQEAMESSAFPNKINMTLIKLKMYKYKVKY